MYLFKKYSWSVLEKGKECTNQHNFANFITYSTLKDTMFDLGHFLCAYLFMEKTF